MRTFPNVAIALTVVGLLLGRPARAGVGGSWLAQGPGPTSFGDTGAVKALAPHPTDPNVLYVGAVNGGVWRTTNATSAFPHWTPLTDGHPSLAISALAFDPTDPTHQTLVAGTGGYSSYGLSGPRVGLMRTIDGGTTWTDLPRLARFRIAGVAPRGSTIVAAVDAGVFGCGDAGMYRSTDGGATFSIVLNGFAVALASDPTDPNVLYAGMVSGGCSAIYGNANGIYKSTDAGATWTAASSPAIDSYSEGPCNVKLSVGSAGNVYVGIVNIDGNFECNDAKVFRSGNAGGTWTQMSMPAPPSGIVPEGQGDLHFSLVADPSNANRVYVGGDVAGIWVGDASLAPGSQWSSAFGFSAPHVDSRDMRFDANGSLLEADDGGTYRRTSFGDWESLSNDMQATEMHDVAYDTVSDIVFGGTQDNGTIGQSSSGSLAWDLLHGGDGGDVAMAFGVVPGQSVRYFSSQYLLQFERATYDASNVQIGAASPAHTLVGGGTPLVPQFRTPIAVNRIDQSRLLLVGQSGVYESFDQADTIRDVGIGEGNAQFNEQSAIAYGGRRAGVENPDVAYVGTQSALWVRTSADGAFVAVDGPADAVVMDPNDWAHAFTVFSSGAVRETTDAGATWVDRTGNLLTLARSRFLSVAYVAAVPNDMVFVGTGHGVYVAFANDFSTWELLGSGLPNALTIDLFYDPYDDVLVAGTLGRGAWMLSNIGGSPPPSTTTTSTSTSTTTSTTLPSCPPAPVPCQPAAVPRGSALLLKDGTPDDKDKLAWKWKSSLTVSPGDFGSPDFDTAYVLCVYDGSGLQFQAVVPSGGFCGTRPCWIRTSKGFKYGNKALTADGVLKMSLVAGSPGKITVKGKGFNLPMPALPLATPVRVQLAQTASTTCWEADYAAPVLNDGLQFKAKSD